MVRIYIILFILLLSISFSNAQTVDTNYNMVTFIEDAPCYRGDLKKFIQGNIIYPKTAKIDSIEGIVIVSFWIDTIGDTHDYQVIKGIREDLNTEALRVAKLIKFEKPAKQRGQPISVKYTIPVEFKLIDKKIKEKTKKK